MELMQHLLRHDVKSTLHLPSCASFELRPSNDRRRDDHRGRHASYGRGGTLLHHHVEGMACLMEAQHLLVQAEILHEEDRHRAAMLAVVQRRMCRPHGGRPSLPAPRRTQHSALQRVCAKKVRRQQETLSAALHTRLPVTRRLVQASRLSGSYLFCATARMRPLFVGTTGGLFCSMHGLALSTPPHSVTVP